MRIHKLMKKCFGIAVALTAAGALMAGEGGKKNLSCDVVILGGGAGGLHTAYRLAPTLGDKVCLFEKENRLGGRIYDVSRTPGGPVFGLGALRIMETQEVVFKLADELGIQYVAALFEDDLIRARGAAGFDSDSLRTQAYPRVTASEGALYDQFRQGPLRSKAGQYPDLRSYMRASLGAENYQFVADMFRFRGDFTYPLSAKAYLEFLDEDWDVCCTPSYPVGGMSEFIKRMAARATQRGARIYLSQPALEVEDGRGNSGRYRVTTPDYEVTANRLVIAVDAEGFKHVEGDLARKIQRQPQFQDLVGVKVASVNQWWPSAWWQNAVPGKKTRRAWTTESCVNYIEIPTTPYGAQQMVTRSVYEDEKSCVDFWEETLKRGVPAVEAEIERGLKNMFPGVTIPKAVKTEVKIWPAGWYWLKAGSPFSNMDIAKWAIAPLPGEAVTLVGESYNPQRSTWSDGAFKSSINALNSVFGMNLPGQTASPNGPVWQPGPGKKNRVSERMDR
jgi:glycine/D-amino acid oxidase-like deaminating enzyme